MRYDADNNVCCSICGRILIDYLTGLPHSSEEFLVVPYEPFSARKEAVCMCHKGVTNMYRDMWYKMFGEYPTGMED